MKEQIWTVLGNGHNGTFYLAFCIGGGYPTLKTRRDTIDAFVEYYNDTLKDEYKENWRQLKRRGYCCAKVSVEV